MGPHRVLRRLDQKRFVVDINGIPKTLSTEVLKPSWRSQEERATTTQPEETLPSPSSLCSQPQADQLPCPPVPSATGGGESLWQLNQRETVRETRLVKPATGARIRANRSYSRERSSWRAGKSLYRRPHERAHVINTQSFYLLVSINFASLARSFSYHTISATRRTWRKQSS